MSLGEFQVCVRAGRRREQAGKRSRIFEITAGEEPGGRIQKQKKPESWSPRRAIERVL